MEWKKNSSNKHINGKLGQIVSIIRNFEPIPLRKIKNSLLDQSRLLQTTKATSSVVHGQTTKASNKWVPPPLLPPYQTMAILYPLQQLSIDRPMGGKSIHSPRSTLYAQIGLTFVKGTWSEPPRQNKREIRSIPFYFCARPLLHYSITFSYKTTHKIWKKWSTRWSTYPPILIYPIATLFTYID